MTILGTPSDAIANALFGHTRRRVLALFFGRPRESFHVREIVRLTEAGSGGVQRELRRLAQAGLIVRQSIGAQVLYGANPASPVYDELTSLMAKTAGVADVIRAALRKIPRPDRIRLALIYGSMAKGTQVAASDVDILVVGEVSLSDIAPALRPAQERIAREINPTVYTPREFSDKRAKQAHFLTSVAKQPKLYLIGSEDDFRDLAGKSVGDGA